MLVVDLSAVDMDQVLHAQRTAQLKRVPKGAEVFLSAGCSGRWYFDWIEEAYGAVRHHIGLEYYSPRPDDLPDNVTWIANTVGNMEAVGADSVDLVFSGQNLEHLWADDVVGFLCESNRVLRSGGLLVMDSPNRIVTAGLNWSHPEHTVEFTAAEAAELCALAGFEVDASVGLWRCIVDGELRPRPPVDELDLIERTVGGLDAPDESFVWWIEARRVADPDRAALEARVEAIFEPAWRERLNRVIPLAGDVSDDGTIITSHEGTEGAVFFGPHTPLPAGRYRVEFDVTSLHTVDASPGWCDVNSNDGGLAVEHLPPMAEGETVTVGLDVSLANLVFGVEFRLVSNGTAQLRSPLGVRFSEVPAG